MPIKYSIITPVYNEGTRIRQFLGRLERLSNIHEAELIVADGNRGTTITQIKGRFAFDIRTVVCHPGRGAQLIAGANLARGSVILILHVDTVLPPDALGLVDAALLSSKAGAFRLRVETDRSAIRFITRIADLRNMMIRIPYGDQCHFFRLDTYRQIGGYRSYPIMEDVEIMRRMKAHRIKISILPSYAVTDDRRWLKEGVVFTTLRNWLILLSFRIGVSPYRLMRLYRPHNSDRGIRE